ncbi:hypothetical protein N2603_37520 [Bradyrhizobium huanghuaihaiense]|uniref:hypothetical protein n=1 Tax=Bradyrhizobium huanghuaihaiense TaxID=990078 RepID=UPI0021AAF4D7|nr:hypothetical protein [Bradyrhizobium sp. CB3035]UWU75646.1 hypothetical protein N2603_37520 [Bradyrhizobium sp. CB3035]
MAPEVSLTPEVYHPADPKRDYSSPGFILSIADNKLCIDNKTRVTKDGNSTWLYQFSRPVAQQWNFVPLTELRVAE